MIYEFHIGEMKLSTMLLVADVLGHDHSGGHGHDHGGTAPAPGSVSDGSHLEVASMSLLLAAGAAAMAFMQL